LLAIRTFSSGPDKEAFHRYLDDFDAVECEEQLLHSLADCGDILPNQHAHELGLPPASTYRDAVRLLLSSWTWTKRSSQENLFD
jgi:hypothetical protein